MVETPCAPVSKTLRATNDDAVSASLASANYNCYWTKDLPAAEVNVLKEAFAGKDTAAAKGGCCVWTRLES